MHQKLRICYKYKTQTPARLTIHYLYSVLLILGEALRFCWVWKNRLCIKPSSDDTDSISFDLMTEESSTKWEEGPFLSISGISSIFAALLTVLRSSRYKCLTYWWILSVIRQLWRESPEGKALCCCFLLVFKTQDVTDNNDREVTAMRIARWAPSVVTGHVFKG